ncbi:MAG: hypothetical protein JXR25_09830 [Pontiellaceae bacterium]|nr:hypothetical protein [Pontiellaceae bacterium]MBN2785116.1 hypothetical protein [Pontiellaceae bacterium]
MKQGILILLAAVCGVATARAADSTPARMPIREITVFKDGHTFIQHSGRMPVDADGNIVMDYLPAPVLGTFWPYVDDEHASLRSVISGRQRIQIEKTALTQREMIEANTGARVMIREGNQSYEATIIGIPTRSSEELEAGSATDAGQRLPQKADLLLIRTVQGTKVLAFDRINDITFLEPQKQRIPTEEFRERLTLDLKWKDRPAGAANVGMIYLQRGIRWIPNYSLSIDDDGGVLVKMEATLINELIDLDDVSANLVVGVPRFAFQDSVDPISLRQDVAQLSSSFRASSQTAFGFSNSIMSQRTAPMASYDSVPAGGNSMDLGPELSGSAKSEDLYIFSVDHITLRKGERMVMPIAEYRLSYTDIYALDIPILPPMEIMRNLNQSERMDLIRTGYSPTVMHKIRIANSSGQPFTTAPAMILRNGRIIAQGMMKYTPAGGKADIELTTAVDINVKKTDNEILRTPNAETWNNDHFTRIDLEGSIALKNYRKKPVTVEITRHVLGNLDSVDQDGTATMINPLENRNYLPDEQSMNWWYRYSWPWWWFRFNGIGQASWTSTLDPGEEIEHTYTWHYFWN